MGMDGFFRYDLLYKQVRGGERGEGGKGGCIIQEGGA
jgi:hypothetical protein